MAETESKRRRSASPKRDGEYDSARKSKFRFKSKSSSRRSSHRERSRDRDHRDDDRHHGSHRHSSKRHKSSSHRSSSFRLKDNPAEYDDTYIPNCRTFNFADPETSFRESLFDAMADDEGAAFWEGVYGQPVHNYSRPEVENEKGELEMMNDEEYAAYVRGKMYEKSHEYLINERKRREEERQRKKKEDEEARQEWQRKEYERLAREKARRQKKKAEGLQTRWKEYQSAWEEISTKRKDGAEKFKLRIPWPVDSGFRKDITKEAVEDFFKCATTVPSISDGEKQPLSLADVLRVERVRWHPDKAMQRWGRDDLSDEDLKGITAVFQVVDSLWAKLKSK